MVAYLVTASFGGYFWPLMMVSRVSALAICVAWTHMNWAASRLQLSTPTTSLSRPLSSTMEVVWLFLHQMLRYASNVRFLKYIRYYFRILSWELELQTSSFWNEKIKPQKKGDGSSFRTTVWTDVDHFFIFPEIIDVLIFFSLLKKTAHSNGIFL